MSTSSIKSRAFELALACESLDLNEKKEAREFIKGLNQEQRALLIKILKEPDAKKDYKMLLALYKPRHRKSGLAQKISRAWKNRWGGRIKSSVVLHEISVAKAEYEKKLSRVDKPVSKGRIEKRLEFFANEPFEIDLITNFLQNNAESISRFAFKNPEKWLILSKKISHELQEFRENYSTLCRLFLNLDRQINLLQIGTQKFHVDGQLILKDVLNLISTKLPKSESSISTMQMLQRGLNEKKDSMLGSIHPQIFASWMKVHRLGFHRIHLSFEDAKKVAPYLDLLDLTHLGLGIHPRKTKKLSLNKLVTSKDLCWLSLFQEATSIHFFQGMKSDRPDKLLKRMSHVERLAFVKEAPSFLKHSSRFAQLTFLHLDQVPFIEGLASCQNLKGLVILDSPISDENWEVISQLPYLKYLILDLPKYSSKKLLFLQNLSALRLGLKVKDSTLQALSGLPKLKLLHLDGDLTPSQLQNLQSFPNLNTIIWQSGNWQRNKG